MHRTRTTALLLTALAAAAPLAAQGAKAAPASTKPAKPAKAAASAKPAPALERAAATITAADVARKVGIIAHDSMQGRDTPSRGLDLTAQYLAGEYKRLGLQPGGENGTWFQRYGITRRRLLPAASTILLKSGTNVATIRLDQGARFIQGVVPAGPVEGDVVVLGGGLTAEGASALPLAGKVAAYVADFRTKEAADRSTQVVRALRAARPAAVLVVSNRPAADFARTQALQANERTVLGDNPTGLAALEVLDTAVAALLRAHGVELAAVRASAQPYSAPAARITARIELKDSLVSRQTAPNVVAILPGSDPKLKNEYVVFSAHMDHVGVAGPKGSGGCEARGADSICNGADDDASGTIGVLELAEAFAQPGARPKRSLVFLQVSGEEKGLWGSQYFAEHPTVDMKNVVANVNIDMIGRNWADTIVAIGKEHSDLGATLNRVNAAHPELRMTAIDDMWPEERFYFRSDHYNFARKGVPILFFFNGVHTDYHQVGDAPDKIDSEKESRILKLLFWLGQDVANTPARPKWTAESYAEIVEGPGGR